VMIAGLARERRIRIMGGNLDGTWGNIVGGIIDVDIQSWTDRL